MTKISQKKDSVENNTTYTYNEVGNTLTVTDAQGTITYTYNINDQVATRTDIYGSTITYAYDQAKRLNTLTYPDGKAIIYGYDDNNNLVKVTDFANRETLYEYDVNGNLVKTTHVNGAYTLYTYDNNSRLLTLKNHNKNGDVISANELTRNDIGDITDNKETSTATVDLSKVKSFNFQVNEFNQITSSAEGAFTYDENGNLLNYKYDGRDNTLEYDISDALTKATLGSDVYSYTYDAEGNRVVVNSKRFVVDNIMGLSKPLAETDSANSIQKYYVWTNGLGYSVDASGEVLVYLYDYQGNTNAILDKDNVLKASYRYSTYGAIISADEILDNPFRYLGQYGIQSDSSALYYVRARYYSPELNRWTQADVKRGTISNPLSLNRYVLNEGDVVNYVDINGLFQIKEGINNVVNYKIGGTQLKYWVKSARPDKVYGYVDDASQKVVVGFGNDVIYQPALKTVKDFKESVKENGAIVGGIDGVAKGMVTVSSAGLSSINPLTYTKSAIGTGIDSGVQDSSKAKEYKDNVNLVVDTIDLVHGISQLSKKMDKLNSIEGKTFSSNSTVSRVINGKTFHSIPKVKQQRLLKLLEKEKKLFNAEQVKQVNKLLRENTFETINQINGIVGYLSQYGKKTSNKSGQ
ncbi:hypothetical protein KKC13_10280 [bacterium]|nr:hypothetical protein [bacterium]MBU1957403.1 hypothetical protein [bacterium]